MTPHENGPYDGTPHGGAGSPEPNAYGPDTYGRDAYDQSAYDQSPYDQSPYDQGAHEQSPYDQGSYDQGAIDGEAQDQTRAPYGSGTYERDTRESGAYDRTPYDQGVHDQSADQPAYDQSGYDQSGYGQGVHDPSAYDPSAYEQGAYDPSPYEQGAYDQGVHGESGCPVRHDQGTTPAATHSPATHSPAHNLVPVPVPVPVPAPGTGVTAAVTDGGRPRAMALTDIVSSPDPHLVYRELRERYGAVAPVELEPGLPAWLVLGYHELLAVTRQEQLFSRDPRNWHALQEGRIAAESPLMPMLRYHPVCYHEDGAEHRRMRVPFDEVIGRLNERAARRLIESRCHSLVAKFSEAGHADLVNEYAAQVPMMSLAGLFGVPPAESEKLVRTVFGVIGSGPGSEEAYQTQHRIIGEMISRPGPAAGEEDLTWTFAHHPNLVTEEERYAAMHLMLIAGNMPTISWVAQTLKMMITDARFAARLRGGRLGVDDALDEALWREPPLNAMPARYVLHDIELGGQILHRGDCLIMGIGAANDDPEIRPSEGEDWGNRAHLAFSAGPHRCPAPLPARLIARTAVRTVLNLLPDIELTVPETDLAPSPSPWSRVPARLPVRFTARQLPETPSTYGHDPVE